MPPNFLSTSKPTTKRVGAKFNQALELHDKGQLLKAQVLCEEILSEQPNHFDSLHLLGVISYKNKRLQLAVDLMERAIKLNPNSADYCYNLGIVLHDLKQLEVAVASYDKAIQLDPDYAEAYYNRGNALQDLKRFDAAASSYDKAIQLKPDLDYLIGMRLHARMHLNDWSNLESNVAELITKIELGIKSSPSFGILSLTTSLLIQRKAAEIWTKDRNPYNLSLGPILKLQRSNKIRIGYFSADFRNHAVSLLAAELFEIHDRSRFELIAFSFGADTNDAMRKRVMAAFDKFIDVTSQPDSAVAILARSLKIDIAIDLGGHTGNNRMGIFSYRAAPIQVGYIGYPGTSGADYIDYLIADKTIIPKHSQQHYVEKIEYLPNSFQVNDRKRVISGKKFTREELGLPVEGFVFCCFNSSYKITPHVFDSWISILNSVTGSVLWLSEANQTAVVNLRKEAEKRGLDPQRLVFAKRMQLPEYLASYQIADLFLDTLPYNAGATASDALWAGLPVITCIGESFASRMAASLLTAINLPELITNTRAEYGILAIELATNRVKHQNIKNKLAANRLTTPLFDTPLFTRHIEDAYTEMYERYQNDLLPDHIEIKH
ncbi:MAG: TPR repeat-containing protein YrrB [Nitrosomonadaceae bacterium]|nr:TPR repeat-containing protein YrrB [Nitrosomonadaceae bacterium]